MITPFSDPDSRIFAALEHPDKPQIPPMVGPPPSSLEFNVNRPGSDLTSLELSVASPLECKAACERNAGCRAFTFVNPGVQGPNARCWLKNGVPLALPDPCCTSGVKQANAPRQPELQPPQPPQPSSNNLPGQLLGCFRDTNAPFDLDGYLERSNENTPQRCVSICKAKGFRFAGVQYGQSCLCGNRYGRYGPADNCNMACTGNRGEMCGGFNSNHIYRTGL